MQSLQNDIGNKQNLQAEAYFEDNITLSLANLYIIEYSDCIVYSVYHIQSKNICAYAIYSNFNYENDNQWQFLSFNQIVKISLNTNYEVVPKSFIEQNERLLSNEVAFIEYEGKEDAHILDGIFQFHIKNILENAVYLYHFNGIYSITLFKNKDLILSNSYECKDENEVLYFITNALQVNGIEKDSVRLYYDYSIIAKESLLQFLNPFFNKILALKHPNVEDEYLPNIGEKLFAGYAISLCV